MPTPTLLRWFAKHAFRRARRRLSRRRNAKLRVGIPRVLNLWSTHQFWIGFFGALGIDPRSSSSPPTARRTRRASSARAAAPSTAAIR